jgi:hypothetical protein
MPEFPLWLIVFVLCIGVLIFYPDFVAKLLATILMVWTGWWIVTE